MASDVPNGGPFESWVALSEHLPHGVVIHDAGGAVVHANRAASAILGLSPDRICGRTAADPRWRAVDETGRPLPGELHAANVTLRTGAAVQGRVMGVHNPARGELRWIEVDAVPLPRGDGAGKGHVLAVFTDVTEKRRALEDLRRSREAERAIGEIRQVAGSVEGLEQLLERVIAVLRGLSWIGADVGASIAVLEGPENVVKRDCFGCPGTAEGDLPPCFARSGSFRTEHLADDACPLARTRLRAPIFAEDGRVAGVVHACRPDGRFDDDAVRFLEAVAALLASNLRRRQAERLYLQAQKMEALGRLAGGIAHDFNNLLAVILATAEGLKADLSGDDPRRDDLHEIIGAGRRAAGLTRQLLAFSRKSPARPEVTEPAQVMRELEKLLRRVIGEHVRLEVVIAPDAAAVRIDPGHLEQVLVNLAVNARDAMRGGGLLRIELANELLAPAAAAALGPDVLPGRHVRISVIDTGTGIPADVLPRIFEPFFTTKAEGQGTGLGLATVFGIVRQAGGHVGVSSVVGEGTRFDVHLPVATAEAEEATETGDGPAALAGRGETILLVEDEAPVRSVLRRLLVRNGYRVLEAADGADGLAQVRSSGARIDLVLADVMLPELSGAMLAELIPGIRPIRTLLMSGYPGNELPGGAAALAAVIAKPFSEELLLGRLRAALDAPLAA